MTSPLFGDDITAEIMAYRNGPGRRDMCKYLKMGGSKYTTIVKPVLDAYEQLQPTAWEKPTNKVNCSAKV